MRNQIGVVVDVGQTCVRCARHRETELDWGRKDSFWCNEYKRVMYGVRYICKNFIDVEGAL